MLKKTKRISGKSPKEKIRPLGFARHVTLVTLVAVLIMTVLLSTYIGLETRETLFTKQKASSAILANYLDNQLFRRFTLPTSLGFGTIDLKHPAQYRHLDEVVHSTIHGLEVDRVRIYSLDKSITYSTVAEEVGRKDLSTEAVDKASNFDVPLFNIDGDTSYWQIAFKLPLARETFMMRTTLPLRLQHRLPSTGETEVPVLGTLEFTQDISEDMEEAMRTQLTVLGITLTSVITLVILLFFIIRRAEKAVALRMVEEQRLLEELHQSEKLASMGRVIASIAHEIRNPLGIIRSSAELLIKRGGDSDKVTTKILQAIYDEAKRLSQTVSDFLDYARPQQPKGNIVDLLNVINQARAFLESELHNKNTSVFFTMQQDINYLVLGDSDYLYRVVYNIIVNAMHAMGQDGTLSISLKIIKESDKNYIELSFHDSGPGFPEEDLEKIMDPFFTTKDEGTGLGLPIVENIIVSHGGSINFSNAPEGGAFVQIILPLVEE